MTMISSIAGQTNLLALNAHRGGARRRGGPRLRGRRCRGEGTGQSEPPGLQVRWAGRSSRSRVRRIKRYEPSAKSLADPRNRRRVDHDRGGRRAARGGHAGDRAERRTGGDRHRRSHEQHHRGRASLGRYGRRRDTGSGIRLRTVAAIRTPRLRGRPLFSTPYAQLERGWGICSSLVRRNRPLRRAAISSRGRQRLVDRAPVHPWPVPALTAAVTYGSGDRGQPVRIVGAEI